MRLGAGTRVKPAGSITRFRTLWACLRHRCTASPARPEFSFQQQRLTSTPRGSRNRAPTAPESSSTWTTRRPPRQPPPPLCPRSPRTFLPRRLSFSPKSPRAAPLTTPLGLRRLSPLINPHLSRPRLPFPSPPTTHPAPRPPFHRPRLPLQRSPSLCPPSPRRPSFGWKSRSITRRLQGPTG